MVDWTKAFLPASFRGVPFRVDAEGVEGGRRLAVHDVVGGEAPIVEDMGRQATRWRVTAYVAGALSSLQAVALVAAFDAPGAGMLVLPWLGPVLARVVSHSADRAKDRGGFIGFDVEFCEAGGAAAFGAVPAASVIVGALTGGIATVAAAVAGVAAGAAAGVLATAAGRVAAATVAAAGLEALRLEAAIGGEVGREIAEASAALMGLTAADVAVGGFVSDAGALVLSIGRAVDPARAAALRRAAGTADGTTALGAGVAGLTAAAAALATVRATYAARPDAVAARADLRDRTAAARLGMAPLGAAAAAVVSGAIDTATEDLSRTAASAAPLVRVETGVSLPASLLAWRLYGDPARAGELVARNRVGTPALMPTVFEAVAPD